MTNDEIVGLVKKFKDGDERAFEAIAKHFKPYFRSLANNKYYQDEGVTKDNVYQECLLGLATKAIPKYRDKNGDFSAFAKLWVRRHLICVVSHAKKT